MFFFRKEPLILKGHNIAWDSLNFLIAPDLGSTSTVCEDGSCQTLEERGLIPESTWKLLAISALYKQSRSEQQSSSEALQKLMHTIVERWDNEDKGDVEYWNLMPIYRAYEATNDTFYLDTFLLGINNAIGALNAFYSDQRLIDSGIFLVVPLYRSLLISQKYFDDKNTLEKVYQDPNAVNNMHSLAPQVRALSERLEKVIARMYDPSQLSHSSFSRIVEDRGCWYLLGQVTKAIENDTTEAFGDTLRPLDLGNKTIDQVNGRVMQDVLPCAEVLYEHSLKSNPIWRQTFVNYMQNLVLPMYDSSKRPLCQGDNSILAIVTPTHEACPKGNVKSVADNGWFSYLLASSNELFNVNDYL